MVILFFISDSQRKEATCDLQGVVGFDPTIVRTVLLRS